MCGRFNLRVTPATVAENFALDALPDFAPRYNVAPTQSILVIRQAADRRIGEAMRWGLIPAWSKELRKSAPLINARSETIFELPSFRAAIKTRRCLIPMSGFYEWTDGEGKTRQPWHIEAADGRLLALGGLWETWRPPQGEPITSCAIVTTQANREMATLHDRMPVILSPDEWAAWLDPAVTDREAIIPMLRPLPDGSLRMARIVPLVNSVRHQGPECLQPLL
jgi:putative SOS response-associated peptidase YedK